ncbi:MAG: hypothetical protein ACTS8H_02390 [Arsenophonus sp. NC-PE1-MAG3]
MILATKIIQLRPTSQKIEKNYRENSKILVDRDAGYHSARLQLLDSLSGTTEEIAKNSIII